MEKIYKYVLEITDEQVITMPAPLKILSAQIQDDQLCLWALVTPNAPMENLPVAIVGTGHPFDYIWEKWEYLNTVQDGPLVWHVFYQDPNSEQAKKKTKVKPKKKGSV